MSADNLAARAQRPPAWWTRLTGRSRIAAATDAFLRGVSQVVLQDSLPCAVLATGVATLSARLLGADPALLRRGLFGSNGMLVGIAQVFLLPGAMSGALILAGITASSCKQPWTRC